MKHVMVPSIKQKPPTVKPIPLRGLESDEEELPYSQNKPKFSQPPNRAAFQAVTQNNSPLRSGVPPRQSPPPPHQNRLRDFQIPQNLKNSEAAKRMSEITFSKQAFQSPISKSKAVEEVNSESVGSLENTGDGYTDPSKPKLKPLHWDKVRASSDRATVWDQLKSSSFQLNEDRMEHLFGCNSFVKRSMMASSESENRVLDPKKSQNIAILLRALNVTREEVYEALMDGDPESLGAELLETLVKMMKEEVAEYFHGNAAKEEAHPLRIFMVVRDFLGLLDNGCKEVKTMQEMSSTMASASARSFRISATASLPVLHRYKARQEDSSSDDEQSSNSSST